METRKSSTFFIRLLQFGLLLAVAGGLVRLLFPGQPQAPPHAIAVEVARVPTTILAHYVNGAVLNSGDIVLTGIEYRASPKSRMVTDTAVYKFSRGRFEKLFPAIVGVHYPDLVEPILVDVSPDGKNVFFGSRYAWGSAAPLLFYLRMNDKQILWTNPYSAHIEDAWRPFSDDGSLFTACKSASGTSLWLYNSATGKPLRQIASIIPGNEFHGFGFLPGSHDVQYIELPLPPVSNT